jgi:hypothetical protein
VSASDETKTGRSVVTDTLQSLTEQAKLCRNSIDLLEAGQNVNRGEVIGALGRLLDASQNLRDAILSEDSTAAWKTREELETLVSRLNDAAANRRRYLDLAQVLGAGTVSHRRERTRQERLAQRDAAVAELMEISDLPTPPELPGPGAEEWLAWACSLEDGANEPDLIHLKNHFPRLDDFVRQLEIEWWHNGEKPAAVPMSAPLPGVSAKATKPEKDLTPAASGAVSSSAPASEASVAKPSSSVSTAEVAVDEEEETASLGSAFETDTLPQEEEEEPEIDPEVAELIQSASVENGHIEAPKPQTDTHNLFSNHLSISNLTDTILSGRLSFFAWSDVEQFTRYIEKAKTHPKEDRQVRALLAVSHWLHPNEQNPVMHPECGIRALTGYTGTSALAVSDPEDVAKAIEADSRLALFTGGAALLRWGLLQPAEEHFNGIAPVRRLRFDQVKAWFGELYGIELADQQFRDIYTLTSGIPILVGEMHKLLIANPDDPPTWIGHGPWQEIKSKFEMLVPKVAQELKRGLRSVRLTDREIALLKMVVIASDNSTPETISANLSENWSAYNRSEFRAMSSRDEACVALLQDLGLLPTRRINGQDRTKTMLPLEPDDAIRQVVKHL